MIGDTSIKERIVRLLMFIILSFLVLRYALGLCLTDIDQIKIVIGLSVCFMFVNTFYPVVVTK